MAYEDRIIGADIVVDKYHAPIDANYSMNVRDYVLRPRALTQDITITLPPVVEARGRFYSVIADDLDNVADVGLNRITITHDDDSADWEADVILEEKGRGAVFYSDGLKWHFGGLTFTSSMVVGAANLSEINLTMDAAGAATVDVLRVILNSEAALGNSAGAIFAQVEYSEAVALVAGLSYALGAEMILPNHAAIASGHYCCIDYEMSLGDVCDWGGGTKVSYMRFACWGTQDNFDDNAFWFTLAAAELEDHLVSVNAQTIRCQIEALTAGINKERHVVLSTEQNILRHVTNVATGDFGMHISATLDDGASEGAAGYFESIMTGVPTGVKKTFGVWTNITEAPTGGSMWNLDLGMYTGADLTGASLINQYMDMVMGAGGAPAEAYQFGFNHSGHALTAFFWASNAGAIAWDNTDPTGGGGGAASGRIKVMLWGAPAYIPTYT